MDATKKRVIVAEDDQFYANIYKVKLGREGYDVVVANNGIEALKAVAEKKPDLILLDLIMPEKDGFETLQDLRKNPDYKDVKVVVISNLGQEEDIKRAEAMGSNGYFVKTNTSVQEMVEIVRSYTK
jgi:two-component system, OmpR family, alkaline phosphatase synthesis response regulator PhoP